MLSLRNEGTLLKCLMVLACLVPIYAGVRGFIQGTHFLGTGNVDVDSHFRYLSGLLLGIGLGFLTTLPHIERYTERFKLLTAIVLIGGLARLLGFFLVGLPSLPMIFAVLMELVVTPALCAWQLAYARRYQSQPK